MYNLKHTILDLLANRAEGATICPSEAARAASRTHWRALMQPTRDAAHALASEGRIVITQRGHIVDGDTAKGPIRFRLAETAPKRAAHPTRRHAL